jgi:hypothetical protein
MEKIPHLFFKEIKESLLNIKITAFRQKIKHAKGKQK